MAQSLPDRELTPNELRQLVESNARAIASNSDLIAQNNQETNAKINQTNETINQLAQATARDVQNLARFMEEFFRHQGFTNQVMQDGLENHQERLDRIDPAGLVEN
jgi:methyl-accepting chemotaxis protein